MSLLTELKRRNVFKVGVAYLVLAWVVIQVTEVAVPALRLPEWVNSLVFYLGAIGFPFALFFAWVFEITPGGVKRESDITPEESVTAHTGRKLDFIIIGLLVVALGYFIYESRFASPSTDAVVAQDTSTAADTVEQKTLDNAELQSIAVLPFVALSNDESDQYFGKGIAEELLNALAQFSDLKVAARTSAFSFERQNVDLREVGETLGVAYVLEGSVRRAGERIRITAQLIRASDGFHLWSETYERDLSDVFAIQDEIVAELSRILQFQLGIGAGTGRAARSNVEPRAFNAYLRGLDLWWQREVSGNRAQAILAFRDATRFDPNFADAWSAYGVSLALSTNASDTPYSAVAEKQAAIHTALLHALEIDPDNVRAHAGASNYYAVDVAGEHLRRALTLAPNDAFVNYAAANYYFSTGDFTKSVDAFERAITVDPLNKTVRRVRNLRYAGMGRYNEIKEDFERDSACQPGGCQFIHALSTYTGLVSAMQAGKTADIRLWHQKAVDISDLWPDIGDIVLRVELLNNFAAAHLGEAVDANFWASFDHVPSSDGESVLFWSSILARHGRADIALDAMEQLTQVDVIGFSGPEDHFALMPGPFEMPDAIRRHPRYHKIWSHPDMAQLADARRANGRTAGLPLPIEGAVQ